MNRRQIIRFFFFRTTPDAIMSERYNESLDKKKLSEQFLDCEENIKK